MGAFAQQRRTLPGFGLGLGITVSYLSLIVLVPLSALVLRAFDRGFLDWWETVTSERALASFKLTFGASLGAAVVDGIFGTIIAWVLVRYRFVGRRIVDALIDLPFALPTAVAGITLSAIYAGNGWVGQFLEPRGITVAYTRWGVFVALVFVGLPFIVRTVQPVLQDLDRELEEAAASLGATRWQTVRRVMLPALTPALLTGFTLAFARAVGEYGSVIFIAGNFPFLSEIAPVLIVIKLEEYDYVGAAGIGTGMLLVSFLVLLALNGLQRWTKAGHR
ncbi:MAG: sulfate ABC transporter permease subunit CysT [Proteobacteria bacterium]|nr:MAG: sulfate ABC transporter permease subunit CysT [Pseudomonadota bacterium]